MGALLKWLSNVFFFKLLHPTLLPPHSQEKCRSCASEKAAISTPELETAVPEGIITQKIILPYTHKYRQEPPRLPGPTGPDMDTSLKNQVPPLTPHQP